MRTAWLLLLMLLVCCGVWPDPVYPEDNVVQDLIGLWETYAGPMSTTCKEGLQRSRIVYLTGNDYRDTCLSDYPACAVHDGEGRWVAVIKSDHEVFEPEIVLWLYAHEMVHHLIRCEELGPEGDPYDSGHQSTLFDLIPRYFEPIRANMEGGEV